MIDAAAFMSGDEQLLYDHVHTTAAGSRKLAELAADAIAESMASR